MPAELIELEVERIGAAGDGVARWCGAPVYLPFTVPGDRVRVVLGARRGGGHEGRTVEILVPGEGRADPPCRLFGHCGGCSLQHLDAEAYRHAKLTALRAALARVRIQAEVLAPLRRAAPARRRARVGL
ncbi:MAG: class I SAM-dependent RNA methyltransferase, partial [Alphaproteobacteria bacterium]|nr:class I SAM-dependent RNA methyltransferase [Alphaproteobacteria bacterium]